MRYRPLGRTGLDVSILGFGASTLGGAFGEIDESEGIRAVHAAIDLGINLFDVSQYYGQSRAELVLGRAIKSVSRDRFVIGTTVVHYITSDYYYYSGHIASFI